MYLISHVKKSSADGAPAGGAAGGLARTGAGNVPIGGEVPGPAAACAATYVATSAPVITLRLIVLVHPPNPVGALLRDSSGRARRDCAGAALVPAPGNLASA